MATTNYYSANGEMYGESTNGVATTYMSDALSSTVGTITSAGVRNQYVYSPYGRMVSKTGTDPDPKFLWNGKTQSRTTARVYGEQYNRRRHVSTTTAQWLTVDPLWPAEPPYVFGRSNPLTFNDPTGLGGCPPKPTCLTWPGGPCAYAEHMGDDQGNQGRPICCDGRPFACVFVKNLPKHDRPPGIVKCIQQHEDSHVPQTYCKGVAYGRGRFKRGENPPFDECKAFIIEINCYLRKAKQNCSGLKTHEERASCYDRYQWWVCNNACIFLKDKRFKCPPSMIPPACKNCR